MLVIAMTAIAFPSNFLCFVALCRYAGVKCAGHQSERHLGWLWLQLSRPSESDLFLARLDQIINLKHELVGLAGKIDWNWIGGEIRTRVPRPRARRPLPACTKLDDHKTPITAADLLNDQVVPLFEEHHVKLLLAPSREERGCSIVPKSH